MKVATGLATLVVAIASTMSYGQANAQTVQYTTSSNPSARCQPALKAYESDVRKRPLAMVNEGAGNAVINCAFEIEARQSVLQAIEIWASNASGSAKDITCTGINGYELSGVTEYLPTTLTVENGSQSDEPFVWQNDDFADAAGLISAACSLPTGTAINDTYVSVLEDQTPPDAR